MNKQYLSMITATVLIIAGLWIVWPFWHAFVWAGIIAIGVWPLYKRWYQLLGQKAVISSLSFTIIIAIIIILPIIWVGSLAASEVAALLSYLKSAHTNQTPAPDWLITIPFIGKYMASLWQQYIITGHSVTDLISNLDLPISQAGVILGSALKYSVIFFFTLVCLFFGLKDAPDIIQKIEILGEDRVSLWQGYLERTPKVIRGVIDSFVIIGLITGIIMGIIYYVLGIPIPVILAVLTALVTVIPFALIILFVAIAIGVAAQGMLVAGIVVLVVGILVNLITDNWIRPLIIGRSVHMHFLATLFGALGGLEVLGFIGLFLGPVIVSLALLVWDEIVIGHLDLNK
ncbi:AI-2E family transporter [Thiotrichales bacterium 19S3-7]|nr:AI-2E family transporter [Thiotrichales bacterium 19S3-7]MCF6801854.1 AI-2E family transporter [Thiotrichales bacterium 19S3-11]